MKCPDKRRFSTVAEAKKLRRMTQKHNGIKFFIYLCPTCGFHHLTKFNLKGKI